MDEDSKLRPFLVFEILDLFCPKSGFWEQFVFGLPGNFFSICCLGVAVILESETI